MGAGLLGGGHDVAELLLALLSQGTLKPTRHALGRMRYVHICRIHLSVYLSTNPSVMFTYVFTRLLVDVFCTHITFPQAHVQYAEDCSCCAGAQNCDVDLEDYSCKLVCSRVQSPETPTSET